MKLLTFLDDRAGYRIGKLADDRAVVDLTHLAGDGGLCAATILRCFDIDGSFYELAAKSTKESSLDLAKLKLAAPVPRPGKIICIGLNYRNHAIESGMDIPKSPIIFSKYTSCSAASGEPIVLPSESEQVDYEAELAVVIGRRAKHVSRDQAMDYVFGYTNFNDVSARDFQFADGQWHRGKSCDTFAPFGPIVVTKDEIPDPHALRIRFRLNGRTMQDSTTAELIYGVPELIEFLSRSITLEPGDIIATGTPPGVGFARKPPVFLKEGDVCEVEIEGLGVLANPVKSDV